ncbi:YebF family protein [Pectobacterium carotovorum]|uniref:YebF family protein n=2 Tax=Pectobacterium carotovorum TaxID=554 RepID=UPI0013F4A351|nr:YebF family protein [Pectobacterium carotovorum]MBB1526905.1 hypothetical protein [Pectobacterium carotovorum subsp. carotovorum]MCA6965427.1 protein YebF [Pectobacterium carotovorum]MCH4987851.1 hypothetical protein [Pectobacterium carotovorum]
MKNKIIDFFGLYGRNSYTPTTSPNPAGPPSVNSAAPLFLGICLYLSGRSGMGWKTKTVCGALAVVSALAGYDYYLRHRGPSCSDVTYEQAVDYVKHDLLTHRIPRWATFKPENLGTATPVIVFDKAASPTLSDPELYNLAFTVSGPQKIHSLFAMYECKTGSVEYASKD